MVRKIGGGLVVLALGVSLSGCTAIPLRRFEPSIAALSGPSCTNVALRASLGVQPAAGASSEAQVVHFAFAPPPAVIQGSDASQAAQRAAQAATPEQRFAEYRQQMASSKSYLPAAIREDAVTNALIAMMTKVSAGAQVEAAYSQGVLTRADRDAHNAVIERSPLPKKLTHAQLKSFADKLFDSRLQPRLENVDENAAAQSAAQAGGNQDPEKAKAFVVYFREYYEGHFVNRLGTPVSKPKLSTTIPDSDIAAAETVLLEFLIDLLDSTPVLGDADALADAKEFYPAASDKKPTFLLIRPTLYRKIKTSGCGVTKSNIKYALDLANGASDRAATVGGLVANTPGGLSIGLGVLGKISIGDNQTLSTLVKTAAAELAARATYAAAFAALEHSDIP